MSGIAESHGNSVFNITNLSNYIPEQLSSFYIPPAM